MNLGYACINSTLSVQKPKVTTNRSMIKKTFDERGVDYAGELSMLNVADLSTILTLCLGMYLSACSIIYGFVLACKYKNSLWFLVSSC